MSLELVTLTLDVTGVSVSPRTLFSLDSKLDWMWRGVGVSGRHLLGWTPAGSLEHPADRVREWWRNFVLVVLVAHQLTQWRSELLCYNQINNQRRAMNCLAGSESTQYLILSVKELRALVLQLFLYLSGDNTKITFRTTYFFWNNHITKVSARIELTEEIYFRNVHFWMKVEVVAAEIDSGELLKIKMQFISNRHVPG